MFTFIKQAFIAFLRFSGPLATKCISLNNDPCLARPTFISLILNELHYYPFIVSLDKCNGSCNTLDDPSCRISVPNKTEYANLNVLNMIKGIKEAITLIKCLM